MKRHFVVLLGCLFIVMIGFAEGGAGTRARGLEDASLDHRNK